MSDFEQKIYVILNPVAGHSSADAISAAIKDICSTRNWDYEIYETTGEEDVSEVARKACAGGTDLVIAAGGDGTVAAVVHGLVGSRTPLGIIPVGTGNGLARSLKIPIDPLEAIELLADGHREREIDVIQVNDQHFVLNVSAGISARSMMGTPVEEKRKLGVLAYMQTIIKDALAAEPVVFDLTIDGHRVQVEAVEVLVSNAEILKEPPMLFGAPEHFEDRKLEVNILKAHTPTGYARLVWDLLVAPEPSREVLRDLSVRECIRIDSAGDPQPVQADGEVIGETPVDVRLVPAAIRVLVPEEQDAD